jgi:uncharacterized membrane protein
MKKNILIISAFSLIFIVAIIAPIFLYFWNFHFGFSNKSAAWGEFGSYVSGTVGSLLSAASLTALIVTLYWTSKNNRETQMLTMEALKKTERQIVLMDRSFKIQLFSSYVDGLAQILLKKKYTDKDGREISRDEFFDRAYHHLAVHVWARQTNAIVENRRGVDVYLPGTILEEMKVSFSEEHVSYRYVLDFFHSCEDGDLKNILVRDLCLKTDRDALFWLTGHAYIYMRDLLSRENHRLFIFPERAATAIRLGEKHAKEDLGPPVQG